MSEYSQSFGTQWQRYRRTQLDSFTGTTYSRDRLERCLGASINSLRGKRVLEVGSGAGRFTEWLTQSGAILTAMDASAAVYANAANCRRLGPYVLMQADVNRAPLRPKSFDAVLCLGVIQHTPSPERTIADLAALVAGGGALVLDHYAAWSFGHRIRDLATLGTPLRAILRRVARHRPELAMRATRALTAICDPVRRRTSHFPALDRIAGRLFPTACYYTSYPNLSPALIYEWNELDTHDQLTDWFKHRRSTAEIRQALETAGLVVERCTYAGNGVEARAHRRTE